MDSIHVTQEDHKEYREISIRIVPSNKKDTLQLVLDRITKADITLKRTVRRKELICIDLSYEDTVLLQSIINSNI